MVRIEKLRIAMEETPDERNVARYLDAEESFRTNGGLLGRERGAGDGGRPRHPRRPARAADQHAVGWAAAPRRTGPHPVRRLRRAVPRRADEPPRRRRQGMAARVPAPVQGRAARDQPRPRAARRVDHPRAPPRPPDRDLRRRGHRIPRHLQPVPSGRGPRTKRGGPRRRRCRPRRSTGCRPSSIGSAPRRPRRRWPTASRSASPASRPSGSTRRRTPRRSTSGSPRRRRAARR